MHTPRSTLHVYQGRRTVVRTDPIAGKSAADVDTVKFVIDSHAEVDATAEDVSGGLQLVAVLSVETTAALPLGAHEWQMQVTDADENPIAPVAAGRIIVSPSAAAPDAE